MLLMSSISRAMSILFSEVRVLVTFGATSLGSRTDVLSAATPAWMANSIPEWTTLVAMRLRALKLAVAWT